MRSPRDREAVWRVRLGAAVVLLAALAFHQAPGLIVPDTKLDLTANPGGFLARALDVWDPRGGFGQLQNQAYGYLFPVGPFHLLLDGLGVPDWITQRLWWTIVLGAAFLGFWRLSGALGVGVPWARYVGALLFALSPRMLGEVAVTSVEVWPLAMAPWVLLPLADPQPRSWGWRISRSALAFAFVGGVNAVASGAALVLPALWLATRRGAEAWRALGVWLLAVTVVSLWWLGPLSLLGRHSPPFLDWIENANVTTAFASPYHALSGTTTWLSFLASAAGASWPAGWMYVATPAFIVLATVPPALGLAGLASRRLPERTFLALGTLLGLVLVTLGHTASLTSPVGELLHEALDGPLAPLRNTHKFELVVRIPLLLAAAHCIGLLGRQVPRLGLARWLVPVVAGSLLTALAAPGIVGRMARPEGYTALPGHWHQTATWLDQREGPGTVLVLPAAGFADFTWGSTKDEPLQALMRRPFAVRDAVPLGSAGATRFLDELERRLSSGEGGEHIRAALRLAGIRYVVMRNDLRADATGNVGLPIHEALAESGMPTPVASFGPRVGSPLETPHRTVDSRTRLPYPSVEVFDAGPAETAQLFRQDTVVRAAGGPEDVSRVVTSMPGALAVLTGSDAERVPWAAEVPLVLTDGNLRREVFFGRASDNRSEVLAADDDGGTGRVVNDYVSDPGAPQTTRAWEGNLREVVASSSASGANATLRLGPAHSPAAAVDGHPQTAWVSGRFGRAQGEWLELRFREPQDVGGTVVRLPSRSPAQARATELTVETDDGRRTTTVSARGGTEHVLHVPEGLTTRLRLTVSAVAGPANASGVAIADVEPPHVSAASVLRVPSPRQVPDAILLQRSSPSVPDCVRVGGRPLCVPQLGRAGEETVGLARELALPSAGQFRFSGTVLPVPRTSERLLAGLTPTTVTASSRAAEGAEGRPGSVVDGNLGTGWVAGADDVRPLLRLSLPEPVKAGSLQLLTDQFLAGSRPRVVALSFGGAREITRKVDEDGFVRWPARRFSSVTIRFLEWDETTSVDALTGVPTTLPVGVSEVVVPGMPNRLQGADLATGAPCGYGPRLRVGSKRFSTSVQGSVEDVLKGRPLTWQVCGTKGNALDLPAGSVRLTAEASSEFSPLDVKLTRAGGAVAMSSGRATPLAVTGRTATAATVEVPARVTPSLLVLPQNFNAGWTATDERGRELSAVRVNGWQQGWSLPAGEAVTLSASFGPAGAYRVFLVVGALMCLACAVAVTLTRGSSGPVPQVGGLAGRREAGSLGVVALFLVGGVAGVAAAVLGVATGLAARRRRWLVVVPPAAVVVAAGLWVSAIPWPASNRGATSVVVQVLVLAATGVACVAPLVVEPGRRSVRRPRRMRGRSRP